MTTVSANHVAEITISARNAHADPFNQVEVDAVFTTPTGKKMRVPAFWAGGQIWKVRYSSPQTGLHRFRTTSSDVTDAGLHGIEGSVRITAFRGENPLYKHGPPRIASDKRHFEHADGTPFFWLGDTWWMGLCKRLRWPDEFAQLTGDRVKKGFTVVQIVAGLYPDMGAFDPRGANEFGFPWTKDYGRIEPEYFDLADRRIAHLVDSGIAPCLVGAWGYHLPWLGEERMKNHWRYLVARYGAYPVFWCVAGEANLPYYLVKGFPFDDREQVKGWTEVTRYVRQIDSFHRPLSIHPTGLGKLSARGSIDDTALLDFDMLQTGHGDRSSLPPTIDACNTSYAARPPMPFLNSEVCYEGILNTCHDDVQRLMFWSCFLSGAAGHTYGANGIWQQNRPGEPYGKSPHGGTYGPTPWNEAMALAGSTQLGVAKKLLLSLPWQKIQPMPGAVTGKGHEDFRWGNWIWYPEGNPAMDAPAEKRYFRVAFDAKSSGGGSTIATLHITADDRFTTYLNGREVASGAGWKTPVHVNVNLISGTNVLAVEAENGKANVPKNPAGLLTAIRWRSDTGQEMDYAHSGPNWRVSRTAPEGWTGPNFDDKNWEYARVIAEYGGGPWGSLQDDERYVVPYCAGIPGELRVIYFPKRKQVNLNNLERGVTYKATWVDPITGRKVALSKRDAAGVSSSSLWIVPPRKDQDWVLILHR